MNPERTSKYVSRYEVLPPRVFQKVLTNPLLIKEGAHPDLQRFQNPDYAMEKGGIFAVGRGANYERGGKFHIQPNSGHRTNILKFSSGISDEFGTMYGQIGGKGGGLTRRTIDVRAKYYSQSPLRVNYLQARAHMPYLMGGEPQGFFGVRHALQDMKLSNLFAARGGRTSRGIAILPIDHKKLYRWFSAQEQIQYDMTQELLKVDGNGDQACIYLRLLGADRLDDFRLSAGFEKPYSKNHMVQRAIRLLQKEIDSSGIKVFQDKYLLKADIVSEFLSSSHSQDQKKVEDALELMRSYFFGFNTGVGSFVRDEYRRFTRISPSFNVHIGNQDILGSWVDWENTLPESGQQSDLVSAVILPKYEHVYKEAQVAGELVAEDMSNKYPFQSLISVVK